VDSHKEDLFNIFKAIRVIRDREKYIKGLMGIENYIQLRLDELEKEA